MINHQFQKLVEKRPLAITILCILSCISMLLILYKFWMPAAPKDNTLLQMLMLNSIAIFFFVVLANLWKMKKWAAYSYIALQVMHVAVFFTELGWILVIVQGLHIHSVSKNIPRMT